MTHLSTVCVSLYYWYSIVTVSVSRTVSEIFSVKEWRDLETLVRGRSRLLKMMPFDRSYIQSIFLLVAIVSIALFYTVFELFDVD